MVQAHLSLLVVFPPPQPKLVSRCNSKLYTKVNHCEEKAKLDWNVKPTDMYSSQSVCCSQYQINDCFVDAAKVRLRDFGNGKNLI